ncbi:MAG: pantoate--beta-alanine ligase [Gemmataceae bacterium]
MSSVKVVIGIEDVRSAIREARSQGLTIGYVPTMGALHAGHASLIRAARAETGFVVVSIFVNPTQFGPTEDLGRYPRAFEADERLCAAERTDLIFAPTAAEMYPSGFRTSVAVTGLQDALCGASRPGHFQGVATVVLKLFNIVTPDFAYFGQKDAQQARILQQMVRDLNLPINLRICPIVREEDGLALSSRNRYLSPTQRRQAVVLYQALQDARTAIDSGEQDGEIIRQNLVKRVTRTPGAVLDYAAVVDADCLQPVTRIQGTILIALAVRFGETRLIDNILI